MKKISSLERVAWFFCLGWVLIAMSPGQSAAQTYFIEGSLGYPAPESNATFSKLYDGRFHGSLGVSKRLSRHHRAGIGAEYAQFRGGLFDDVDMHLFIPSAMTAYGKGISDRLDLEGTLRAGFAWIFYRSTEDFEVDQFDESGLYLSPGIQIVYESRDGINGQIGVGYKVIFEHFGDESAVEDSTIRYLLVHGGIAIGI